MRGRAMPGEKVSVSFGVMKAEGVAGADGRFLVLLPAMEAALEPRELIVSTASGEARVGDVLVGEVWICSGQSNMEWSVDASDDAPRARQIESLPTLPKGTDPTPEFVASRKIELDQIAAARTLATDSIGWRQRFVWPVTGRISGVFGSQRIYAGEPGAYHSGVDVARPEGTEIVAPADGVVILAAPSPFTLEGNLLMVDHGMGLNSAFLHLSRIDVTVGQAVKQGQKLGAIGMTGRATGPHLHWSIKWREARIDPQPLAGEMP